MTKTEMERSADKAIIGLVSAHGASGVSSGRSGEWSLVIHFVAWRGRGEPVVAEERRCELAVERSELDELRKRIPGYAIVEVEIDESLARFTRLRRVVSLDVDDADLKAIAQQLKEPIVLDDPMLGKLRYERRLHWYEGRVAWCGETIDIHLSCEQPQSPDAVRAVASQLLQAQHDWSDRVRAYAIAELLPLKNMSWLEEGEEALTPEAFASRMSLQSIQMDESGDFTFWYDDGDLFWGHSIQISGDLSTGPTDADIPG